MLFTVDLSSGVTKPHEILSHIHFSVFGFAVANRQTCRCIHRARFSCQRAALSAIGLQYLKKVQL